MLGLLPQCATLAREGASYVCFVASSFEIIPCLEEGCDGLTFIDRTGYFGTDNPWGYNAPQESVPTLTTGGVFGYESYTLSIWRAQEGGYDEDAAPIITADLLTRAHTIDEDTGYVSWTFTWEDLGLDEGYARSGWWFIRIDPAVWEGDSQDYNYATDQTFAFTQNITKLMDDAMIASLRKNGFSCGGCKCGGTPMSTLYQRYRIIRDFMPCNGMDDQFTTGIDWLYTTLPLCGCK